MSKGFYAGSRTSSGLLTLYRNGAAVASDSSTVVHNKPNQNIYLLAMNSSGAAAAFTGARCGFYSIGLGLDATEAAALNDAVQTLQRNLDRQVN